VGASVARIARNDRRNRYGYYPYCGNDDPLVIMLLTQQSGREGTRMDGIVEIVDTVEVLPT
jgi:hypothetical protein